MKKTRVCALGAGVALLALGQARAADHLDSLDLLDKPAADINDVYAFTSGTSGENLVLALSVNRFANNATLGGVTEFDANVLYQFKIDQYPFDGVADFTIEIQFNEDGTLIGAGEFIRITGLPSLNAGAATVLELDANGMVTMGDVQVFAGQREDPFFFDLKWFFDVGTTHPLAGVVNGDDEDFYHNVWGGSADLMNTMANAMTMGATDTFAGANVSMIVLEFPASDVLTGSAADMLGVWAATRM